MPHSLPVRASPWGALIGNSSGGPELGRDGGSGRRLRRGLLRTPRRRQPASGLLGHEAASDRPQHIVAGARGRQTRDLGRECPEPRDSSIVAEHEVPPFARRALKPMTGRGA